MSGEHPAMAPAPTDDRRTRKEVRILVPTQLQDGWLAFQSEGQRRRLAPIPAKWASLADEALIDLLEKADRMGDAK